MAQNEYHGKWERWLHKVSNGRWIVAEQRGEYWFSKCADLPPNQAEIRGHNVLDLVGKGCRTYASPNTAVRALKRVYNPEDASETRPEG